MFGENPSGEFGRLILLTGEQRGGPDGGPVCRFLYNTRSGALYDLGRIDCFAVEPHHHTQLPRLDAALDSPEEIRTDLAERRRRLTRDEWDECAHQAIIWLREHFTGELRAGGWPSSICDEVERVSAEVAVAAHRYLREHPPTGLATS